MTAGLPQTPLFNPVCPPWLTNSTVLGVEVVRASALSPAQFLPGEVVLLVLPHDGCPSK